MTFDQLACLVQSNHFKNDSDQKIAIILLESQRDYSTSQESLKEFLDILEEKVDGNVTKASLNKLLKRYS